MPKKRVVKLKSINDFRFVTGRAGGTAKVQKKSVHWFSCNKENHIKKINYLDRSASDSYSNRLTGTPGNSSLRAYSDSTYTTEEISPTTRLLQFAQFIGFTRISDPRAQLTPPVFTHFVKHKTPCWNTDALNAPEIKTEVKEEQVIDLPNYVNYTPYDFLPQAGSGGLVK